MIDRVPRVGAVEISSVPFRVQVALLTALKLLELIDAGLVIVHVPEIMEFL